MQKPSRRLVLLALALTSTACSDAAALRQGADRRMPVDGPVGSARAHEAAAVVPDAPPQARARDLPDPLSFDACIAWALENNRDLRQQISSAERSRLGITVARSQVYAPQLTASTGRTLDRPEIGSTTRTDDATSQIALSSNAFGFTVSPYAKQSWSQTDGGSASNIGEVGVALSRRLLALNESARQDAPLTSADRNYAQNVNSLALRVRQLDADAARSFLGLQQAEARLRLREQSAEQAKAFLASVREAVAAGLKAPVEETNAMIDYNQAQADLLSDRTALADARDGLLSFLDRPLGGTLNITPLAVDDSRPDLPPMDDDIALVLARHEDLANLHIDLDAARDGIRFQSDNTRPDLTGTVSALRRWTGPELGDPNAREDVVALTVSLAMPLDAWSGESAKLMQLSRQMRELKLRIRAREADLEVQVRTLRRRIDRLVAGVDLAKQRLAAETAKFNATQASYEAGRVDNLELTRARQTLAQAEVDLLQSRIDLLTALSDRRVLVPPAAEPVK